MFITCKIADILFKFNIISPLTIANGAEKFRGFAINNTDNVDYPIDIIDAISTDKINTKKNLFSADNSGMPIGFKWSIAQTDDNCDCITVDYDNDPTYNWVQLILRQQDATMLVCRKEGASTAIDPFIYPLFNIMLSRIANRRGAMLIHCSLIEYNGEGYLFTAPSGTGKSTMARIWRDNIGATIINDDMLFLVPQADNTVIGYNIPMSYYIDRPKSVRLKAMHLIFQSPTNVVKHLGGAEATMRILGNSIFQSTSKEQVGRQIAIVNKICTIVNIYEVGFKPDADIIQNIINQ